MDFNYLWLLAILAILMTIPDVLAAFKGTSLTQSQVDFLNYIKMALKEQKYTLVTSGYDEGPCGNYIHKFEVKFVYRGEELLFRGHHFSKLTDNYSIHFESQEAVALTRKQFTYDKNIVREACSLY